MQMSTLFIKSVAAAYALQSDCFVKLMNSETINQLKTNKKAAFLLYQQF